MAKGPLGKLWRAPMKLLDWENFVVREIYNDGPGAFLSDFIRPALLSWNDVNSPSTCQASPDVSFVFQREAERFNQCMQADDSMAAFNNKWRHFRSA